MGVAYVWWHGGRYSPAMRDAMAEWERLARAEGIPFTVTQGGWNAGGVAASAGTHDGDAADLKTRGLSRHQVTRLITLGRMIGMAAWFRTGNSPKWGTPAHKFASGEHIHAVPNGWGSPSRGARNQATAYRRGRDGLALDGVDAGPGHTGAYRTRTWSKYQKVSKKKEWWEDMDKATEAKLRAMIREESQEAVNRALWQPMVPGWDGVPGSSVRNVLLHIYNAVTRKAG